MILHLGWVECHVVRHEYCAVEYQNERQAGVRMKGEYWGEDVGCVATGC